jgi:glycosyltransferase involved in cell wall biosynthesis
VPNVSIIIPAHNEERHIEKCIESLLAQDYQDIEIIVVDNGSKDNTPKIVENYVKSHGEKVRLLRLEQNLGIGGGRNVGAFNASGDILVLVDADMVFPSDYIRKLISPIQLGEALLTTHSTEYVANISSPWVKVQGQIVRSMGKRIGEQFRAVQREFFIRHGGLDPRFQYHADRTFFYKTGAKGIAVEDAYCYHNNPDTAKEIFRRNYWIGRTFVAVMYHEYGVKGLLYVSATALVRLLDLVALPLAAAWAVLSPANPLLNALFLAPFFAFTALTIKMKIVKAESLKEKAILRILYAPLYRIIRAAGLLTGVFTSLIFGLLVTSHETAKT